MDNESYIYPINPDDPLSPEKVSVVRGLDESSKVILNIRRDKENLFLLLITVIISIFIGFFTQTKNIIMILLLLNGLTLLIIWRINSYKKEEVKLSKFFDEMEDLRGSLDIPKIPIK